MGRNGEGDDSGRGASSSSSSAAAAGGVGSTRVRARGDPLLIVCRCFSFITALTGILCIAVNVLSAIRSYKDGSDVFDGIFRCYAVVITIIVVVTETEWSFIFKFWKVLEYWAGRGMLQIFVAVMTRAFPDTSGKHEELVLLQNIASYMLLGCGVVYVISGILCIGFLKRARQKKEVTRDQAVKDLEELERRREELEALLIQERVEANYHNSARLPIFNQEESRNVTEANPSICVQVPSVLTTGFMFFDIFVQIERRGLHCSST